MNKNLLLANYEINPETMAVIASQDEHGNPVSYIIEETTEYMIAVSPTKLIDEACKFFGASLRGRQEGTRDICGLTHKVPVSIDATSGMYFFPTYSPASPKCSWINHSYIDQISRTNDGQSVVFFKNGKSIKLDVSYGSLLNQIRRTAQFRYLLDNRIKYIKNQMEAVLPEEL